MKGRYALLAATIGMAAAFYPLSGCSNAPKQALQKLQATSSGVEADALQKQLLGEPKALQNLGVTENTVRDLNHKAWGREANNHIEKLRKSQNPAAAEEAKSAFYRAINKAQMKPADFGETDTSINLQVGYKHLNAALPNLEAAKSNGVRLSSADTVKYGALAAKAKPRQQLNAKKSAARKPARRATASRRHKQ